MATISSTTDPGEITIPADYLEDIRAHGMLPCTEVADQAAIALCDPLLEGPERAELDALVRRIRSLRAQLYRRIEGGE
jgi:hypothetical protein